jgi:hypothetical protein
MRQYISHQRARAFGRLAYHMAKTGSNMLVTYHGQQFWLGYVQPHGFYLTPFQQKVA